MMYFDLFFAFFKIGLFGFGGGLAMLPLIYESILKFQYMSQEQFSNIVAIAQITPGPIAINAATYIGYQAEGIRGSFFATLGVVIPAFIIVTLVCMLVTKYKNNKMVIGALEGIRPATVGMIGAAVFTMGKTAFLPETLNLEINIHNIMGNIDYMAVGICIVTLVMIGKFKISPIKTLIIMGGMGAVICG